MNSIHAIQVFYQASNLIDFFLPDDKELEQKYNFDLYQDY
jgi:hypothetical protein